MKKIIILVACTLVILIGIQLYWIQNAYTYRQSQLNQQVNKILFEAGQLTVKKSTCFELFGKAFVKPHEGIFFAKQQWQGNWQFVKPNDKAPDSLKLFFKDDEDTTVFGSNSIKFMHPLSIQFVMKCEYHFDDTTQAAFQKPEYQTFDDLNYKSLKDNFKRNAPIVERLKIPFLDSTLHKLLSTAKFSSAYHYGIIRDDNDSIEYASVSADNKKLKASRMHASLIDDKYFSHPYKLVLYFDSNSALALNTLWGILLTSIIVVLLLCYSFWYFIRTINTQKKLSEMKTDFINNMTHEFKTPITNIGLAVENINEKGGLNGNSSFLRIIGEENNRLKDNVERILQIAALKKEEVILDFNRLNINHVIENIVNNIENSHYPNNPDIQCSLVAEDPFIMADETHLINIIYNLLDNALKYCKTRPEVHISTKNTGKGIILEIKDNGIGMDNETQKKVFEKFYRAHTGNIHNVKGFGLGLSYVKNLVDLHGGSIKLESEPGKGSTFEIFLPFSQKEKPVKI